MFTDIHLINFKCFEDLKKPLKQVNLFTGYNGTGKSSILQTFLLLAQSIKNGELRALRANGAYIELGDTNDLVRFGTDKNFTFEISSDQHGNFEFGFTPNRNDGKIADLTHLRVNGIDQFGVSASIGELRKEESDNLVSHPHNNSSKALSVSDWSFLNVFKNLHYIAAGRIGSTLYERSANLNDINPIGADGTHKLEIIKNDPSLQKRLSESMEFIMDCRSPLKVESIDKSGFLLDLVFTKNNNHSVRSINTGFGFSYILPILIASEICGKGTILIENPEAHLHPQAQSRLMTIVANNAKLQGSQLFIESHSEHVLNGLRLACLLEDNNMKYDDLKIYFFDKSGKPTELEVDDNAQITPWPEGFFDQQQKDSSEILHRGLLKD